MSSSILKRGKKTLLSRIRGIQSFQEKCFNLYLSHLEGQPNKELNEMLNQKEILWRQKSKSNWIIKGDKNTQYFHTKTTNQRNNNKVTMP